MSTVSDAAVSHWARWQHSASAWVEYNGNIPLLYRIVGALDVGALGRALTTLVAHHDALRMSFEVGDHLRLRHSQPGEFPFEVEDLAHHTDAEAVALRRATERAAQPLPTSTAPLADATLLRVSDGLSYLILLVDHRICDGHGLEVLLEDLGIAYRAIIGGETPRLRPSVGFGPWIDQTNQALGRSSLKALVEQFRAALGDPRDGHVMLPGFTESDGELMQVASETFVVGALVDLHECARSVRATVFVAVAVAVCRALAERTDRSSVIFSTPVLDARAVAGRSIGEFTSGVSFRAGLERSFADEARELRRRVGETMAAPVVLPPRLLHRLAWPDFPWFEQPRLMVMMQSGSECALLLEGSEVEELEIPMTPAVSRNLSITFEPRDDVLVAIAEFPASSAARDSTRLLVERLTTIVGREPG